jgi:hypothetical protein
VVSGLIETTRGMPMIFRVAVGVLEPSGPASWRVQKHDIGHFPAWFEGHGGLIVVFWDLVSGRAGGLHSMIRIASASNGVLKMSRLHHGRVLFAYTSY